MFVTWLFGWWFYVVAGMPFRVAFGCLRYCGGSAVLCIVRLIVLVILCYLIFICAIVLVGCFASGFGVMMLFSCVCLFVVWVVWFDCV